MTKRGLRLLGRGLVAGALASLYCADVRVAETSQWSVFPPRPREDGVYGRLDGNWDMSIKRGRQLQLSSGTTAAISTGSSLHFYSMVGLIFDVHDNLEEQAQRQQNSTVGSTALNLFFSWHGFLSWHHDE